MHSALIRSASKNQPLNGRTPKCWRCAVANMARRLCRRKTRPSRNPFRLVPADDPRLLQDCFCCTFSPAGKEPRDRGKLPREGKMLHHGFSKSRHTWGMQDKYSSGPPYLWAQAHCLPNNESCMQAMVYAAMLELVCCDGNAERAAPSHDFLRRPAMTLPSPDFRQGSF